VDQGDQFPRNPFNLIGVPVHSQGAKANATMNSTMNEKK
jgi:hypothetical protein